MTDNPRILSPERLAELRRLYGGGYPCNRLLAHIYALTDQAAELRQRAERAEAEVSQRFREACRVTEQFGELRTKLLDLRAEAERVAASPDVGGAVSLARAILERTGNE